MNTSTNSKRICTTHPWQRDLIWNNPSDHDLSLALKGPLPSRGKTALLQKNANGHAFVYLEAGKKSFSSIPIPLIPETEEGLEALIPRRLSGERFTLLKPHVIVDIEPFVEPYQRALGEVTETLKDQIRNSLLYLHYHGSILRELASSSKLSFFCLRPRRVAAKVGKLKTGGYYPLADIFIVDGRETFIVPRSTFTHLGSGRSKKTYLGQFLETHIMKAFQSAKGNLDDLRRESRILKLIEPSLRGKIYKPLKNRKAQMHLLIPFANKRDLNHVIEKASVKPLSSLLFPIADCVQAMHERGIIIRDLSLKNFLLFEENGVLSARIYDLGHSTKSEESSLEDIYRCTPRYGAPECLAASKRMKNDEPFDGMEDPGFKVDIFSLAVVFFDLLQARSTTCKQPNLPWIPLKELHMWYNGTLDAVESYKELFNQREQIYALPEKLTEEFSPASFEELIAWMAHPIPKVRPSIEKIKESLVRLLPNANPSLDEGRGSSSSQ